MSLDNVLGVAGAAGDHYGLLAILIVAVELIYTDIKIIFF